MLITVLAIRLESKGPAIFRQTRLGKDHREFTLLKFRSMVMNAEHTGSGVYSGSGDARVTKVGRILWATSIDELPQAINILRGDMSLIGPRPPLTCSGAWATASPKRSCCTPTNTTCPRISAAAGPSTWMR